jgi:hypothetical protein
VQAITRRVARAPPPKKRTWQDIRGLFKGLGACFARRHFIVPSEAWGVATEDLPTALDSLAHAACSQDFGGADFESGGETYASALSPQCEPC